jgi:phage/plasmid-associated DNA primase
MVGDFIKDKIKRANNCRISHKDLYDAYVKYCKSYGVQPDSKNKFGRMMNAFNFGADLNYYGVRMHRGISLKE